MVCIPQDPNSWNTCHKLLLMPYQQIRQVGISTSPTQLQIPNLGVTLGNTLYSVKLATSYARHACCHFPAGHMVPQTNPREALDMFQRFLARQPLTINKKKTGRSL